LKTAVRREIERGDIVAEDLVASFVAACMEVLTKKLKRAVQEYTPRSTVVVGGVSASPVLRELLSEDSLGATKIVFPSLKYSTDNAAMIGAAGWWRFVNNGPSSADFGMMPRVLLPTDWRVDINGDGSS
jgi:N6-L-threonylcarbamoyladenine synthase